MSGEKIKTLKRIPMADLPSYRDVIKTHGISPGKAGIKVKPFKLTEPIPFRETVIDMGKEKERTPEDLIRKLKKLNKETATQIEQLTKGVERIESLQPQGSLSMSQQIAQSLSQNLKASAEYARKHPYKFAGVGATMALIANELYSFVSAGIAGTLVTSKAVEKFTKVYEQAQSLYNVWYGSEAEGSGMRTIPRTTGFDVDTSMDTKLAKTLELLSKISNNIFDDERVTGILNKMSHDVYRGGVGAIPKSLFEVIYPSILRRIEASQGNTELNYEPTPEELRFQRDAYLAPAFTTSKKRDKALQQGPNPRAPWRGERDRFTAEEIMDADINARKYVNERGSRGAVQNIPYAKNVRRNPITRKI